MILTLFEKIIENMNRFFHLTDINQTFFAKEKGKHGINLD